MTLRADKAILSVLALATALSVSGVAGAQPYPRNYADEPWSERSAPLGEGQQQLLEQDQEQPQERFRDQDQEPLQDPQQDPQQEPRPDQPHDGRRWQDQPEDQRPWREQDQAPDQNQHGGEHPDTPYERPESQQPPENQQQPDSQNRPDSEDQSDAQDQSGAQERPDETEVTDNNLEPQFITLYEEHAPEPVTATAQGASGQVQTEVAGPVQPSGGLAGVAPLAVAPANLGPAQPSAAPAGDATDITASISPAPAAGDALRSSDAMRPAAPADDFPTLPAPPAVDAANAMQADAIVVRARALLEAPVTYAGSRLDAAQQAGVRKFYAERAAPLWLDQGQWTPAARAVQGVLERAWEDGLEPADYPAPDLRADPEAVDILAAADVRQSINAVKYARDASGGRLDLPRLSRHITSKPALPASADVLTRLASAAATGTDVATLLRDHNPKHAGYLSLRQKLVALRAARPPEPPMAMVPEGPVLRVGMSDPRVALVRSRLGLTPADDVSYDAKLAAAVAEFQRRRGLKPTGRLTRQTVVTMAGNNLPSAQDESALIVNMERWRWLPRDLGSSYIFVNVPEYRMRLVRDGSLAYETRIVVGKAETPTPIFSDIMQYAVINPYWNVPPSILKKEFLPGLARDPGYAAKRGYEVIRRGNAIHVRQPPGERNSLGHIKFMFPNDHAVYLHDTPSRALFGRDKRAFSHGCVRVDQPLRFGELVLGPQWPQSRIKRLIGRGERTVRLKEPLPIHLAYFTTSIDQQGVLHSREDIYGIDARMRVALERLRR